MKIVIDMQACQNGSRFRGIGRYTMGIVSEILNLCKNKHVCHLLFNGMFEDNLDELIGHFSGYVEATKIHIWYGIGPVDEVGDRNLTRRRTAMILKDAYVQNLQPDLVFLPTFFEGWSDDSVLTTKQYFDNNCYLCVVTCHDLIPLVQTEVYLDPYPKFKQFYLSQTQDYAQADGFLAVSESSRQELHHYLNIPLDKIENTLEGVEAYFTKAIPNNQRLAELLKIPDIANKKIILYSGASDERKNHLKLIKAFALLDNQQKKQSVLVFAGGMPDVHMEKFRRYAVLNNISSSQLIMTGRISDADMINLYRACYLFIFPSWHEGFGLPALEAMACGAPVLAANTTSLPEVVGREDLLFDPYQVMSIRNILQKFIQSQSLRDSAAEYCYQRAQQFTWQKSANIAVGFFEKLYQQFSHKVSHEGMISQQHIIQKLTQAKLLKNLLSKDKENLAIALIKNYRPIIRKARLYIDLSVLIRVDFATGIQRVTKELYQQILKNCANDYEIIPLSYRESDLIFDEVTVAPYARSSSQRFSRDELLNFSPSDIFIGLDLNYSISSMTNTIDRMKLRGCKVYFLVHDFLPLKLGASFFDGPSVHAQYNWLKQLKKADGIIAISATVMQDVKYFLDMYNGYDDGKIAYLNSTTHQSEGVKLAWSHHGADFSIPNTPHLTVPATLKQIDFSLPTYLMVGTIEPRKGHLEVIEAFSSLWEDDFQVNLLIVAQRTWNSDLTLEIMRTNPKYNRQLFWLKDIDDTALAYLYSHSTALIAASIDEGFGLPIIEALQYNLPVICRDIPIFREVGKDNVYYFTNLDELADLVKKFENIFPAQPAKLLTWEDSANNLMDIILNNNFIDTWLPDNGHYVLPMSSEKFHTKAGEKQADRIQTKDNAGLLVYGGYISLLAGNYQIKFIGNANFEQQAIFEVGISNNKKVVKKIVLNLTQYNTVHDIPNVIATANFELKEDYQNIVFYIKVTAENDFSLRYLKILKLD